MMTTAPNCSHLQKVNLLPLLYHEHCQLTILQHPPHAAKVKDERKATLLEASLGRLRRGKPCPFCKDLRVGRATHPLPVEESCFKRAVEQAKKPDLHPNAKRLNDQTPSRIVIVTVHQNLQTLSRLTYHHPFKNSKCLNINPAANVSFEKRCASLVAFLQQFSC